MAARIIDCIFCGRETRQKNLKAWPICDRCRIKIAIGVINRWSDLKTFKNMWE